MNKNVANNVANEKVQDYVKKSHNMTENEQKKEKATQDVQKNCLSLTEQWKNGELEEGAYYVKLESGKIDIYFMVYDDDDCDEIVEVLSPVSSYGDRLINEALIKDLSKKVNKLIEENAKLKELLSKCVSRVDTLSDILDFLKDKVVYKQSKQLADMLKSTREIIKEINEVLK